MDAPIATHNATRRSFAWILHAAIFLVGLAAGAALIYSLQPPKPPPHQLVYDLFLFGSDAPVTDFAPQLDAMRLGAPNWLRLDPWWGPKFEGNMQRVTTPNVPATISTRLFNWSIPFTTDYRFRIDVVGEELKQTTRTKLTFRLGKVASNHQFELGNEEVRVIQLDSGNKPGHPYFYAMVRVQPIKPAP